MFIDYFLLAIVLPLIAKGLDLLNFVDDLFLISRELTANVSVFDGVTTYFLYLDDFSHHDKGIVDHIYY